MRRCTAEFVIEPFTEGSPGPHVVSGIDAMEARGLAVSMGPFGSSVAGEVGDVLDAAGAMVAAAVESGAHRVLVDVVTDTS